MNDSRLLRSLQRLNSALSKLERQIASNNGVSVSQLRILTFLEQQDGQGGVRVSDLAEQQALAVSTMTRNVALLERKGWVIRQTGSEDRRTVQVALTEAGLQLSIALRGSTANQFSRAFSRFHPSDRLERAVALDRVAAALERVEADG